MILADTNVVSEFMKDKPDPSVLAWAQNIEPVSVTISVVTVEEVERGLGLRRRGRGGVGLGLGGAEGAGHQAKQECVTNLHGGPRFSIAVGMTASMQSLIT